MIKARSLRRTFQEQTRFLYNFERPKAWLVSLYRSHLPEGSDFEIEIPDLNESQALVTAKDLGRHKIIRLFGDSFPLFADKKIAYEGQTLALLCAESRESLRSLERSLRIRAREPEQEPGLPGLVDESAESGFLEQELTSGDETFSLDTCPSRVESTIEIQGFDKSSYEPRGAIAEWKDDTLLVYTSTSWPHHVRRCVSEATGLSQKHITVFSLPAASMPDRFLVDSTLLACYAAIAALSTMKPCQLLISSQEDRRFSSKQAPISVSVRSGHTLDGRLLALETETEVDLGAFPLAVKDVVTYCLLGLSSTYRCPVQRHKIRIKNGAGAPRFLPSLFGLSSMQQALEEHVHRICSELEIDEVAWRTQHLMGKADHSPYGPVADHTGSAHQVLLELAKKADYRRKYASLELLRKKRPGQKEVEEGNPESIRKLKGIGLALSFQPQGTLSKTELETKARLSLELTDDGHLTIGAPMHLSNVGIRDAWLHYIEEYLGIEERNISFQKFSSAHLEDTGPVRFSRVASLFTPLLVSACKNLKQKIRAGKAPFTAKASFLNQKRLTWDDKTFSGSPFLGRSWMAACVELSVDPVDLGIGVRSVTLCVHAGTILHEERALAALRQQVSECLEWLCGTRVSVRLGGASKNSDTFKSQEDSGDGFVLDVEFLNQPEGMSTETRLNRVGGLGELCYAAVPAAFHNALSQALGAINHKSPVEKEDLFLNIDHPFVREAQP